MHDDFGAWLHNHQKQDVYYAVPRVYQKEDGFFGVYTITSTVDSLLPIKPEAPFGMKDPVSGEDIQIATWYAAFYDLEEETFLGQLPYEAFVKEIHLSECERYDAKMRKLPGMRAAHQRELIQQYGVDI